MAQGAADFRSGGRLTLDRSGAVGRWTSYPLSRTGWLRLRHAQASQDRAWKNFATGPPVERAADIE